MTSLRTTPAGRRPLRTNRDRAALAGSAGTRSACTRPTCDDPQQAQVLRADDVPLPVGRPAHRSLVHRRRRPTRSPATSACRATTSSSRSASTPSGCPPRTPPSRAASTRATWTLQNIDTHAPPAPDDGRHVRLGRRAGHLRARVLPLEPVVLPEVPGERAWPIAQMAPVDWCPKDQVVLAREQVVGPTASAGAAARRSSSATWSSGSSASPVRRRAAGLRRHRLARADQGPCRPTGSAAPRAPR